MTHVSPFRHVARSLPMVTEQHKYKTFSSALVFPSKKNTLLYLGIATCFGYGPGSSVGIATELRAGRSVDRIPLGRVFPPVQTCPGAHTQPPVQWVPGLSRGKLRPGRAADHSPPSSAAVMEE